MTEEIKEVHIIPARFIKYREDGNILLKCLQDDNTVDRAFEPKMFKDIENIDLIFYWCDDW